MPVTIDLRKIGSYYKLADKTAVPNGLPPRLNESSSLYGTLDEELDLRYGMEGYEDKGYGDRFHSLFDYIQKTSKKGSSMEEVFQADFVSNRRNLAVMARSPYCLEPIEIQAIRQNGIIFLCEKSEEKEDRSPPYGYKFEQYMTLGEDGNPRDKFEKVSNAECARGIFRTTLTSGKDEIKVFYAAEMDAIDKNGNFVEMKTTAMKHWKWLERQSLNHYLQSFLGGVPYIIYGQKKSYCEPVVFRTEKVWTHQIPKDRVNWDKDVCFEALFNVLQKIKSKLEYDEEALVVSVTKDGICFEPECSNNCTFLDPEFLNHFEEV